MGQERVSIDIIMNLILVGGSTVRVSVVSLEKEAGEFSSYVKG